MTTIATIGAGNIATAVARLAAPAGHRVVMTNSRGPDSLRELVTQLGSHVTTATAAEAVAYADFVVLTVPLKAVATISRDLLDEKVVIDTVNYYPERDGRIDRLDQQRITTSELMAEHFDGARVVKGFNNIVHWHLATLGRLAGAPDRSVLPIAGDDPAAKRAVAQLFDELGYDTLDAGRLADSWRFERDQPAYCLPYAADQEAMRASRPGARPREGRRVTREELAARLSEATR